MCAEAGAAGGVVSIEIVLRAHPFRTSLTIYRRMVESDDLDDSSSYDTADDDDD